MSAKITRAAVLSIEGATNEETHKIATEISQVAEKHGLFLLITNTKFSTCDLRDLERVLEQIRKARRFG